MRLKYALLLALAAALAASVSSQTSIKVDQVRVRFPDDGAVKLVGMIKDPAGVWRFTTVHPQEGFLTVTTLDKAPYESDIRLDSAYVIYRTTPPAHGGKCVNGTGGLAADATSLYICTPDSGGQTFSWTKFSGGTKDF